MRKLLILTIATISVASCAPSIPLEEYEAAQSEIEQLTSELRNSRDALEKKENELDAMDEDFASLQGEYDDLSNFTFCGEDLIDMDNMIYGVSVARRGWAEKKDLLNCLSLEELRSFVGKKRKKI